MKRRNYERKEIVNYLEKHGWNITQAAKELGIPKTSFLRAIKRFGIQQGIVSEPEAVKITEQEPTREEFTTGQEKKKKSRVLVIGDMHEPFAHRNYLEFVREVYNEFGCDKIVFIGDVVDNHSISYHDHNPDGMSPGSELQQAKKKLQKWAKAFPEALVCIGNHDELLYRKAVTHGLPNEVFRGFNGVYGTPVTWQWRLSWELDNVLYQHGTGNSGESAHKTRALKNRQSTVIGHVHSHAGVAYMASEKDLIFGMNVGCGIDIKSYAMLYGRNFVCRPTLGCGVVLEGKHAFFIPMDLGTKIKWA